MSTDKIDMKELAEKVRLWSQGNYHMGVAIKFGPEERLALSQACFAMSATTESAERQANAILFEWSLTLDTDKPTESREKLKGMIASALSAARKGQECVCHKPRPAPETEELPTEVERAICAAWEDDWSRNNARRIARLASRRGV